MAPQSFSSLPPREAKQRQEWQEADNRRKKARRVQASKAVFTRDSAMQIADLKADLEERRHRMPAENLSAVSLSISAAKGTNPLDALEAILDQLNEDYSIMSHDVDAEDQIPEPVQKGLARQLQYISLNRLDEAKRLVNELRRRLQGNHKLVETEAVSAVKNALITITQQLRALNRNNLDLRRRTAGGKKKAGPAFTLKTNKLPLTESLAFDVLLKEFKEAAEVSIEYVKVTNSLREQLRAAEISQWKAERDAQNARLAASQAQAKLGLIQYKDQRSGGGDPNLLLQLEQSHKGGEEMKREILRLRNLPGSVPRRSKTPILPRGGEVPFTGHESHILLKLIESFPQSSSDYQKIIKILEKGGSDESLVEDWGPMGERYARVQQDLADQQAKVASLQKELERQNGVEELENALRELREEVSSLRQLAADLQAERIVTAEELDRTKQALEECKFLSFFSFRLCHVAGRGLTCIPE